MTDPQIPERFGRPEPLMENLVRASLGTEFRADVAAADGRLGTLVGRLVNYGVWSEVRSAVEGHFMERTMPGAFTKTFAENRSRMQVIFDHGQDQNIGRKPLGPLEDILDRSDGIDYQAALIDAPYTRELEPGLRAGLYGSSYRFSVPRGGDSWNYRPKPSPANPEGIPERTVTQLKVMELGPTPFPVGEGTTAGLRSKTDQYQLATLAADPDRLRDLVRTITSDANARSSSAAWDASEASSLLSQLLAMLGEEQDDPEQAAFLQSAVTSLQSFISSEAAEIGTSEDMADSEMEMNSAALPAGAEPAAHSVSVSRSSPPSPPPIAAPAKTPTEAPKGASSDSQENRTVSEYVTRDDKAARVAELRSSIARRATEYDGVLPPDIQASDDAENSEHDLLVRDIAAWDARQDRIRSFAGEAPVRDGGRTEYGSPPAVIRKQSMDDIHDIGRIRSETRSREEYDTRLRENAMRSVEGTRLPKGHDASGLMDIVERYDEGSDGKGEIALRILATGSPVYKRAFNKYLAGQTALWTQEEARAAALAVTATTTTGGYAVPYVFDPTMIHIGAYTAQNPFRAACRVVTITNGNLWKAVTVGNIAADYGTEGLVTTEGGPTFGQPSYQVQTARAFVTLSFETLEDRPDISGELTSVFAEGKATLEENKFAVGAGTTVYPLGMFTATAYTATTTATNDVTALADTQLVENALPLRFRAKAEWFMNRSTMRQLMALDTGWRYFSGAGIQFAGNQNPTYSTSGNTGIKLLGYDIWEVPSAVSTLTTDAALLACLVDPQSYVIVDRIGMNVEVVPQMFDATTSFPTLQRGILCYWRNFAKPINADAGRMLKVQ